MRLFQQGVALLLSWCLVLAGARNGLAYQTDAQTPPQAAQQSADQLQQLVAPIALYPDGLIAQILPAATFPAEILDAQRWMDQHKELKGDALANEVDKQAWDPSVKALTQFPAVLANMNQNLAWTSELGDVYANQQQDLTNAIQTMRQRAKQAGNLQTTPQEKVTAQGQNIVIEPASPDVVYVPQFDPWLVYGDPLAVFPGWYPYAGLFWDSPGIGFGLGFGIGFFGGFGWGWHHWGYDWHGHGGGVRYNHNAYISHSMTTVNRGNFRSDRANFNHAFDRSGGRSLGGQQEFHSPAASHPTSGMHSGAFSGFDHGGFARSNASRGQASFGGFHGGGGGGFHGGGGGFHGGGGGGHR
jgi:uncharacterized membrane protein YgcG